MAHTEFRLATLLKLRQAARDECRHALSEAMQAERSIQAQITAIESRLHQAQTDQARTAVAEVIHLDSLRAADDYRQALKSGLRSLHAKLAEAAAECQRRRDALTAADREVQMLDKLRERHSDRELHRHVRAEANLLDEAATRSFQIQSMA
ncbi:MAG: flagellar export protein FliJ [Planctomycetia bacterium]|nr:flagellar export protein FliJ [Planctomycetia bacterium]